MDDFIYAKRLKKYFTVNGCFYEIKTNSSNNLQCRNVLEIYDNNYKKNLENFISPFFNKPDALVVMMNPGLSYPISKINEYEKPILMNNLPENILMKKMVLAKPDTTQFQVMRLMKVKNWKHIRILNLSDIREPKSNEFIKTVKDFEKNHGQAHSIFSEEREKERELALSLKQKEGPVILAWGTNKSLRFLAERTMKYLKTKNVTGVQDYNNPYLFRHPSPTLQKYKEEWLQKIMNLL